MFAYIQGSVASKNFPSVVIDVQGIGYELFVSIYCFEQLPELGDTTTLLTHFLVREDAQMLYGFSNEEERNTFRLITKVSGFGAKVAMSILSSMSPHEFQQVIANKDKHALTRMPGIGPKSADRLLVELGDTIGTISDSSNTTTSLSSHKTDAEAALASLGYKATEIQKALQKVDAGVDLSTMIRQALQFLART